MGVFVHGQGRFVETGVLGLNRDFRQGFLDNGHLQIGPVLVAIVTVERDEGAGFQGINEEALHGGNGRILETEVIRFQVRSRTEWTASTLLVPRKDWK